MMPPRCSAMAAISAVLAACLILTHATAGPLTGDATSLFAETFDTHWERLRDDYPYFELYGVDWDAERAEHRPRALAAKDPTEFAWELARLISALPDPHVAFMPAIDTMRGLWSIPELDTYMIGQRVYVTDWPESQRPVAPALFADARHAYPEIVSVRGEAPQGSAQILAAGPVGTTFSVRLRWPDGSEADHELQRPPESNLPPPDKHFGDRWLVTGRVGSIGYLRVQTFDPERCTLGPDGKMTTMLRAALAELSDTAGLILDLQGNGGGLVAASDPFLGNLIHRTQRYRWGNSAGKTRVIRPRSPRYRAPIVALVDGRSASGGEWAARILRDAGRATVIGERTAGAEAAVQTSTGADGSVVHFSAWPMVEPGVTPFQGTGIELDHDLPLTIDQARTHGLDKALKLVRRARLARALKVLGAPATDVEALVSLAEKGDAPAEASTVIR